MQHSLRKGLRWTVLALVVGCASYTQTTMQVRSDFMSGRYDAALQKLDSSGLEQKSTSKLLYYLEKSMILDRLGQRDKSRNTLLSADRIVDELYTTSVLNTAASFIVSDNSTDYEGEDYEKIAIHTILALSFLQDQKLPEASVEARKINSVLANLTKDYDGKYNGYKEDAFATYLAGMIHEARGEIDDAIIDYNKALNIFSQSSYQQFYRGGLPHALVQGLYRLAQKRGRNSLLSELQRNYGDLCKGLDKGNDKDLGQIVAIHEVGHIAVKHAQDFVIPIGRQIVRFSFPVIPYARSYSWGISGIAVNDRPLATADNVADMNAIAHFTLEDRRGRMMLKSAARLLAKGQLTEEAYKNFGPLGGLAANAFSAITETADTRSWTLLPEAFYVSRIWLPAGKYQVRLQNAGRVSQIVDVDLKPGEMKFFRDI